MKKENDQQSQSSQSSQSSNCEDERSIGNIIFGAVIKGIIYATYYSAIGDYETENHLSSTITKYPYYDNHSGNYESTDSNFYLKNRFRFDLDYQFLYYDKNLTGNHFKCNIRPFQYFYLQGQYHQLTERRRNNTYADLSLYNFNFCYDRLRFKRFNLGWKLGMCYISNNINKGGFSFGLDAEAFLIKPVSLYVSQQWGAINNVAVNEFEIAGKFHIKRYNIHAGYEHLKIGSPLYDYVFLGAGICL